MLVRVNKSGSPLNFFILHFSRPVPKMPRASKRAASPAADVPAARKQPKRGSKAEPIADNSDAADAEPAPAKKPAKKAAAKSKTTKKAAAAAQDADVKAEAEESDSAETEQKDTTSKAQFAKSKYLDVPVDENCSLSRTFRVFIDDKDGIIYDASLNQTNSGANNNKFYRIQVSCSLRT